MKQKNEKSKTTAATRPDKPTMIVFPLDRSGSMAACRKETVDGFNAYLKELQTVKDESRMTLRQFDSPDGVETVYENVPVAEVRPMTTERFQPRGGTPLYDAMGATMTTVAEQAKDKFKVLFVVLTDGYENASKVWNYTRLHEFIRAKEDNDHWTFVYISMGAEGFKAVESLAQGTQSISNCVQTSAEDSPKMYAKMARASNMYRCATNSNAVTAQFWSQGQPIEPEETKEK